MNIQEAKTEIKRTFRAYTRRTPDGRHRIPPQKQRPVLLIGPPGIGKTAVMGQIAEEEGCGLVAYSMTHHTRQSAIGLPFISRRTYNGREYAVTEYTMSEIVASIYDYMARTGKRSGLLFLDEINCVSETLTPVMLQLLQNKTFGNVPLPEDWVIVAAGNPPEYNQSVRELDMVTLDRVKYIEVEADLAIWREYARQRDAHPAVMTYLHLYPDHFYRITDTDRGQLFVTARGWEDLSLMLRVYEEDGIAVDAKWFLQYLQYDEIARSFGLYYDLFRHFTEEASNWIEGGTTSSSEWDGNPKHLQKKEVVSPSPINDVPRIGESDNGFSLSTLLLASPEKLEGRSSTECLALAGILLHPIRRAAEDLWEARKRLSRRGELVGLMPPEEEFAGEEGARAFFEQKRKALSIKVSHGVMKRDEELREGAVLDALELDAAAWRKRPAASRGPFRSFESERIEAETAEQTAASRQAAGAVEDAYRVLERCPQGRSALLYLTNDLAASKPCAQLLSAFPVEAYGEYLKQIEG